MKTTKNKVKPPNLNKLLAQINKHKEAIAKHRDALRVIVEDLECLGDSLNDGVHELEAACDILSEYV